MIPAPFQTRRALQVLNVGAVGLALATVTAAVLSGLFHDANTTGVITAIPTLLVGTLWAWVLRLPKTVSDSSFRWGWVASMPLAMLNASVAAGLLFMFERGHSEPIRFIYGAMAGATMGAVIWLPALFATLVCFGAPIAWAQRLAKKGLAGEERGEWIVGIICVVMSLLGLLISLETQGDARMDLAGLLVTRGCGVLGLLAAASSTGLAFAREARRRRFVADAEAGKIAGYRVDPTDEGKVLVRVVTKGEGYRVADFEEEIFELDAGGEAKRPKVLAPSAAPR